MHKDNIGRLYLDEGKDVRDVRDTMKRNYSFEAHEKAYKRKFEEWGLTKNVPKEEGLFMVRKREERREQGKETIFWRRRRPEGPLQLVPDDKVDRIADRYSHDLNSFPDGGAVTPENIEYSSPQGSAFPTAGSRTRHNIPSTSAGGWPFPAPATAPANGVGHPPTLPGVHTVQPPVTNGAQPHYYPQAQAPAPAPEELNPMIGHTNPNNNMNWDPWTQQYY